MARPGRLWINATLPITTLTAGTKAVYDLAGNAPEQADNATVSRIIGWMRSRQVFPSGTFVNIWVGVTVISQQAFDAGPGAVATPGANLTEADWMYVGVMQPFNSATEPAGMPELYIDNRSQRRRPGTNKVLALCVQNDSGNSVQFAGAFRILLTGL